MPSATSKITIGSYLNIPDLEPKELAALQFVHSTDYKRKVVFVTKGGRRVNYDKESGQLYDGVKHKKTVAPRGRPQTCVGGKVKITVWVKASSAACLKSLTEIEEKKGRVAGKDFSYGEFIDNGLETRYPEHCKNGD